MGKYSQNKIVVCEQKSGKRKGIRRIRSQRTNRNYEMENLFEELAEQNGNQNGKQNGNQNGNQIDFVQKKKMIYNRKKLYQEML